MTEVKVHRRESLTVEVKHDALVEALVVSAHSGVSASRPPIEALIEPPIQLASHGNDWLSVHGSPIDAPIEQLVDGATDDFRRACEPRVSAPNRQTESFKP